MKKGKTLTVMVAVLTALLCAALCVSVLWLYADGVHRRAALQSAAEPLFTREAAGRCLLWLSPLFALWLAAVIAARLWGADPEKDGKPRRAASAVRHPMRGQPETKTRRAIRAALYVAAAVLIVLGILNGGLWDVLVKATNICSECIGLG